MKTDRVTERAQIPADYREDDQPGQGHGPMRHPKGRSLKLNQVAEQIARLEADGFDPGTVDAHKADSVLIQGSSPSPKFKTRTRCKCRGTEMQRAEEQGVEDR